MNREKLLILGCGRSGIAAANLAAAHNFLPAVVDAGAPSAEALPPCAETIFHWTPKTALPACKTAVISPGISIRSEMADCVRSTGAKIIGELEFASRFIHAKILAVTGTNGKTTTTELTAALINAAGLKAASAGNIGNALSASAEDKLDWLVVETSSFQLESCENFRPDSAALLNLASDHINRHGTFEEYKRIKLTLFRSGPAAVINANVAGEWKKQYPDRPLPTTFSAVLPADFHLRGSVICFHDSPVFDMKESQLPGVHNIENVMASLALLRTAAGDRAIYSESVRNALRVYKLDAHKLERIRNVGGVLFIDDSKGTNPHSVAAALRTIGGDREIVLLLGGLDKDMDFSCIGDEAGRVRCAFLYGQCREKILRELGKSFPCELCNGFEEAIRRAFEAAKPKGIVLLSPACASFDMFNGYAARGDAFKKIVAAL